LDRVYATKPIRIRNNFILDKTRKKVSTLFSQLKSGKNKFITEKYSIHGHKLYLSGTVNS